VYYLRGEASKVNGQAGRDPSDAYAAFKERLRDFMNERDWKQFHNPKDLAIALSLEASELLEHFLWKNGEEVSSQVASHGEDIRDEAADIGIYLMELCDVLGVDLVEVMSTKLDKAGLKYPVEKAKGTSRKYTELDNK
jgi:dCTP diphosphatase